jgi:iron complex outermembrane receptor protein
MIKMKKIAIGRSLWLAAGIAAAANGNALTEQDYLGDFPVVLSVSRLAQPLDETPGAVTVIDRDTIRRSGAREVADVLRLVPGFILTHMSGSARPVTTYHAEYDSTVRHLQVFIDGRSVYSSLLLGSADFGMMGVTLDDIERIEVLRGSNSAAYGANAFLGVVNIVTRHAIDTRGGMVMVTAGQTALRDGVGRIGWGDERAAFRITASTGRDDGFRNLYDGRHLNQLHFRGDLQPSAQDEVLLTAGSSRFTWGVDDSPTRDENWRNHYASAHWTRQLNTTDQIKFGATADQESYENFYPYLRADGVSRRVELEVQHAFVIDPQWRFVWGGRYRHEQVVSSDLFVSDPDQRFSVVSLFGNVEWKPHPQWVVNAGGLWDKHSDIGGSTAPRLMVNFHALPGQTLRVGATTAYKLPTLFELRADWPPLARVTGNGRPERIDASEIGYLGQFSMLHLTADVRIFDEKVRDLLGFQVLCPGCLNDVINKTGDTSRQRGWETQLKWQPIADTQVLFNYTQLALAPTAGSSTPQDRYRAPSHYSTLALFQRLPHDLDLSVIYTDSQPYFSVRQSDMRPTSRQVDVRLAHNFRIGATRAEAAVTVRAAGGSHIDYVERGLPPVIMDRRALASLRLEF